MDEQDILNNSSPVLKLKKRVKFKKDNADEDGHITSKKRKILNSKDLENTENITSDIEHSNIKVKMENPNDDEHHITEEEIHEHSDETQANDTIDWPQSDLRTLVQNIEQSLPEKDNLAFQTRADKLNWDDIAFDKYNGDECKRIWFLIQKRIRRFRLLSELLQDAKQWISKPWTHFYRGNKTNRHPDMPKRPLSGYMLFYVRKKDKLLAEFPGLEMTEVSKRMAQMYKNLSIEKREQYMQLAVTEKKVYEEKLEEFYRLHPDIPKHQSEKSHHSKTVETGPKKPSTPFSLFYKAQLHNFHSDLELDRNTFKEQCKEQWKSMSDKKKIIWIDSTLEEEEKYQEEIKNYMIQNPNFVTAPFKTVVTKEEKSIKERLAGKPIKPPNSAYSLFSQMMLKSEEIKKIDPKGRMKALADQWKSCSDQEKKLYQEHCEQLMAQYKIDFANYIESLPESKRQEELQNNLPKRKVKKGEDPKNKIEEDKTKMDDRKFKLDNKEEEYIIDEIDNTIVESDMEKAKTEEKARKEEEKAKKEEEKVRKEGERIRKEEEKMRREEEKKKEEEAKKAEEEKAKSEVKQPVNKKRKKKNVSNNNRSNNEFVSLAKIFEAQPANPPVSGFALFSKRYHGKAPVETAWKNLNKLEKKEYEGEVRMLKQRYIKEYEIFLKSLNKEQLTAFSQMKKMESISTHEQNYKDSYSDDEFVENSDSSE